MSVTEVNPRDKMYAFARRQGLATLTDSLLMLDGPKLDEAQRLTRAVLIDVICEKCPEADAAFERWAESDEPTPQDPRATQVIVAAVRAASGQSVARPGETCPDGCGYVYT